MGTKIAPMVCEVNMLYCELFGREYVTPFVSVMNGCNLFVFIGG